MNNIFSLRDSVDFATIIGIIGGFGLVIIAMVSGGGFAWFVDWPSAMIVLGRNLWRCLDQLSYYLIYWA